MRIAIVEDHPAERELIAINLGYQEANGVKTEWDDIASFL